MHHNMISTHKRISAACMLAMGACLLEPLSLFENYAATRTCWTTFFYNGRWEMATLTLTLTLTLRCSGFLDLFKCDGVQFFPAPQFAVFGRG
jgi:hypothetical protein